MLANHSVFTIILVNCRARALMAKLASPSSTGKAVDFCLDPPQQFEQAHPTWTGRPV